MLHWKSDLLVRIESVINMPRRNLDHDHGQRPHRPACHQR